MKVLKPLVVAIELLVFTSRLKFSGKGYQSVYKAIFCCGMGWQVVSSVDCIIGFGWVSVYFE